MSARQSTMNELPIGSIAEHFDAQLFSKVAESLAVATSMRFAVYGTDGKCVSICGKDSSAGPIPLRIDLDTRLWSSAWNATSQGIIMAPDHESNFSVCAVPVLVDEESAGLLVNFFKAEDISEKDREAIICFTRSVAALLTDYLEGKNEIDGLVHEVSERYEELTLIYELNKALDVSQSQDRALSRVCRLLADSFHADLIIIRVPSLKIENVFPQSKAKVQDWAVLEDILAGRVAQSGTGVVVNDLNTDNDFLSVAMGFSHAIATFFKIGTNFGALTILRRDPDARFFMGDLKLLDALATQTSLVLSNAKVVEDQRKLHDASLFALARLAEARDPETGEHLSRVRVYVRDLAHHMSKMDEYNSQIDEEYVEDIFRSSPLHDIGKVGIPDSVLLKPGKLTSQEWEIMKTHTKIGGDTLRDVELILDSETESFLSVAKQIAYNHHEKWDGSGYPEGLEGEEIPLCARIMALADVYDAVTSNRCYRTAMTHEEARKIIVEGRGTHFAPPIVDAFLAIEGKFIETKKKLQGLAAG